MFPVKLEVREDALFLRFISSWGWAMWKHAWRHFDPLAQGYEGLLNDAALREQFDLNGHDKYFKMLQAQRQAKVDSWAIRWYVSVFLRQGLALYLRKTLVRNLGFDGSGLNCEVSELAQADLEATFRVSSLPSSVKVSAVADTVFSSISSPRRSLAPVWNKAMGLLREFTSRAKTDGDVVFASTLPPEPTLCISRLSASVMWACPCRFSSRTRV
jgi:hypothetical protein